MFWKSNIIPPELWIPYIRNWGSGCPNLLLLLHAHSNMSCDLHCCSPPRAEAVPALKAIWISTWRQLCRGLESAVDSDLYRLLGLDQHVFKPQLQIEKIVYVNTAWHIIAWPLLVAINRYFGDENISIVVIGEPLHCKISTYSPLPLIPLTGHWNYIDIQNTRQIET